MSELAELRQEIAKTEERVLAAISTMGKSVGDDLGAIRAELVVVNENHLAIRAELVVVNENHLAIRAALEVVNENHLAIRAALEVISENHLAPEHQQLVKRKLASVGRK